MNTMLDILKSRLPEGLEIVRVKDRVNSSQIVLTFRYRGIEIGGYLQKACAPGYAEQNCDYTISSAMMGLALNLGDRELADHWSERLLACDKPKARLVKPMIPGMSPHQPLVGQTFFRDCCRMLCLAAHENAILILQHGEDDRPINYIVCHGPEARGDTLVWDHGDYFTIPNYQNSGRSNPVSAALADAMDALLDSMLLEFHFEPIEDEPDNQSVFVLVSGTLSPEALAELEDSIASYLESMESCGFVGLVEDVMKAQATVSFRILNPDHTFHI